MGWWLKFPADSGHRRWLTEQTRDDDVGTHLFS
jgi:hypothetical protein